MLELYLPGLITGLGLHRGHLHSHSLAPQIEAVTHPVIQCTGTSASLYQQQVKMETYRLMDYSSFKGVKVSESRKITHWAIFGKSVERLNPLELYPWKTAWHVFLAFSLLLLIILSDLLVWWCTFCSKLIFSNCSVNLYLEQWQRDSISYKAADVFISANHTRICFWSSWLPNPDVPWNSFFLFHNHNLGVEYNLI